MLIDIVGKNGFEATQAIKDYIYKRLDKVVKLVDSDALECRVALQVYPNFHKVELTLLGYKHTIRSEEKAFDMYAAIDLSTDTLLKQVKQYQDKRAHYKKPSKGESLPIDELEKDVLANQLIKNKKLTLKPMSVEEAIDQMILLGHDFFIFLDEHTHQTHVVYQREDGNFAVIETKV
jgi:putative sigma-54 modulation protein